MTGQVTQSINHWVNRRRQASGQTKTTGLRSFEDDRPQVIRRGPASGHRRRPASGHSKTTGLRSFEDDRPQSIEDDRPRSIEDDRPWSIKDDQPLSIEDDRLQVNQRRPALGHSKTTLEPKTTHRGSVQISRTDGRQHSGQWKTTLLAQRSDRTVRPGKTTFRHGSKPFQMSANDDLLQECDRPSVRSTGLGATTQIGTHVQDTLCRAGLLGHPFCES